jgi:bifunctional non-homologous end joining protein LigD
LYEAATLHPCGYNCPVPQGIEPSNLDKVFWPDSGLTKGDLIAYLDSVAEPFVRAVKDRPLTLKRYPDGIDGFSFFQKNTPKYAPEWIPTVTLRAESARRDVRYLLCNSKRVLLWLANQAAIEFHPWLSKADHVDRPDFMVFDMDPPEGKFDLAVEMAFVVREVLGEVGLEAVAKTSGSKGVHVYVPVQRRYGQNDVRGLAARLGKRVEEREPKKATTDIARAGRAGRVFVDTNRNALGQHLVAPYSPRARPGATVSFPVDWTELGKVRPEEFTIRSVPDLLRRNGDPWRDRMPSPQSLTRAVRETNEEQ